MKQAIKIAIASLVLCFATTNTFAQRVVNGRVVEHAKATGIIHFVDGTEKEMPKIRIPVSKEKKVVAYDAAKKKHSFNAKDIAFMELWNENNSENHYYLFYLACNYPIIKNVWAVLSSVGEHAMAYQAALTYSVDNDGSIVYVLVNVNAPALILYEKATDSYLVLPNDQSFKRKASKFLAADPEISAKIKDGTIKMSDFKYIIENYNPVQ